MRSRAELDGAVLVAEPDRQPLICPGDPADPVDEVHMPGAAAEFAVGHAFQADLLLHLDDIADRGVLDAPQLLVRDAARLTLGPGAEQFRRAQQAPDMVGT